MLIGLISNVRIHIELIEQLGIAQNMIAQRPAVIRHCMKAWMHIEQIDFVRVGLELSVEIIDKRAIAIRINKIAEFDLNELVGARQRRRPISARRCRRIVVVIARISAYVVVRR